MPKFKIEDRVKIIGKRDFGKTGTVLTVGRNRINPIGVILDAESFDGGFGMEDWARGSSGKFMWIGAEEELELLQPLEEIIYD